MEWNEESITRLRTLWAEGHSTAEIGRRMNVSKNAVVGKAHRLGLLARPSPIRRDVSGGQARPPSPRRATGPTLPPLPGAEPAPPAAAPVAPTMVAPMAAAAPPLRPAASPPVQPVVRAAPVRVVRSAACCWPIGEPGTPSFRFCDAAALSGKPYCAEHAQLAYVRVRDRREEAA